MADLHMEREHKLGLVTARRMAQAWAREVEKDLELRCRYEAGADGDTVHFERSGVTGRLRVTPQRFELDARLGLLLGAFKGRIESEITRRLDALLSQAPAGKGRHG